MIYDELKIGDILIRNTCIYLIINVHDPNESSSGYFDYLFINFYGNILYNKYGFIIYDDIEKVGFNIYRQ